MAKQNNSKLIKKYTEGQFNTELWWNDKTKQFDIWRNKKVVKTLSYKGMVLFEDMVEKAKIEADEWFDDTEKANLTLNEYLQRNNIQLTQLELDCLYAIFSEGSFYEESANYNEETKEYYVNRKHGTFIGWYIDESEVPGCRGALSSLQKKGILTIEYDSAFDNQAMYFIYFTPEFKTGTGWYHDLKIDAGNLK